MARLGALFERRDRANTSEKYWLLAWREMRWAEGKTRKEDEQRKQST
jgi:hypothetical protein